MDLIVQLWTVEIQSQLTTPTLVNVHGHDNSLKDTVVQVLSYSASLSLPRFRILRPIDLCYFPLICPVKDFKLRKQEYTHRWPNLCTVPVSSASLFGLKLFYFASSSSYPASVFNLSVSAVMLSFIGHCYRCIAAFFFKRAYSIGTIFPCGRKHVCEELGITHWWKPPVYGAKSFLLRALCATDLLSSLVSQNLPYPLPGANAHY